MNDSPALLFGVDVIARIHPHDELGALFDHELFHMYHRSNYGHGRRQGRSALPRALGRRLATYVSGVLKSPSQRKRDSGSSGRPGCARQAQLPQIARELLQKMDSASPDLYQAFFLGNSADRTYRRSGYYVGLLIGRQLGQSHSLQQLAKMNGSRCVQRSVGSLQKMALLKSRGVATAGEVSLKDRRKGRRHVEKIDAVDAKSPLRRVGFF